MELLLEQLERFAEVVAVSRTRHAGSWGRVAVRRALRWARYLRHVHGRFRHRGAVRAALVERLRSLPLRPGPGGGNAAHAGPCWAPGPLRSFAGLGRGDQLLALGLLENAALPGPALHELLRHLQPERGEPEDEAGEEGGLGDRLAELARRRAASQLLLPLLGASPPWSDPVLRRTEAELLLRRLREEARAAPGSETLLLDRLWVQLPQPRWLNVVAEALLLPLTAQPDGHEDEDPDEEDPASPVDLSHSAATSLLTWLLARPAPLAAFCRLLPAPLLASLASHHSSLGEAFLDLLRDWGSQLHFDPVQGAWVGAGPEGLTWERLRDCFRGFCQSPSPLRNQARAVLDACKARDGGFEAQGLSVWTDLMRDIGEGGGC
ncbi:Fanconi anemia group F protein [Dromiciops gliroides]|uniref:Fanconi anemia group F protein n=1 Tax=Dromiciops gliroides TaxID=33562 RepID=UPI001CC769CD|nr:Fanconi anemia group F protein [Dromiciops gliroides]